MPELFRSAGWAQDDQNRNRELGRLADAFDRIASALEKIADKPTAAEQRQNVAAWRGRLGGW